MIRVLQPLGVDFFCLGKKFLVYNLISRNLKIKYRRSVVGIFWTLLAPIAVTAIYYFVFKVIMKVSIPHHLVFILSGVLFWNFFAQSLLEGMESIVGNWGLISKVPIPLQIFPYVGTLTNLVTLTLAIPVLLGAALVSGLSIGFSVIVLPFYLVTLFLLAYGFAFILAVGFVYFRDLRHLMGILMQIWFYATPVVYNEEMIPEKYGWVLIVNPLGQAFSGLHHLILEGTLAPPTHFVILVSWTLGVMLVAAGLHRWLGKEMVEHI